jgi:hypothetical protein
VWKTLDVDLLLQLREVQLNGAMAQAQHASELLTRIAANPNDPLAEEEAYALYEAYLHDPYLTKNQE